MEENENEAEEVVKAEDKRSSEVVRKEKAEAAKKQWLSYTPEEKEAIREKQREAARKMWAERNRLQRAKVGKLISAGRSQKGKKND